MHLFKTVSIILITICIIGGAITPGYSMNTDIPSGVYFANDKHPSVQPQQYQEKKNNVPVISDFGDTAMNIITKGNSAVAAAARRNNVPVKIALAVAKVESGNRCNARNHNAKGVMQILPRTAASVGISGNLFDCNTGAEAGVRYLAQAIRRGGATCAGISLYNTGIKVKGSLRCTSYGQKVIRIASNM